MMLRFTGMIFLLFVLFFRGAASDSILEYDGSSDGSREWLVSSWITPPVSKDFTMKVTGIVLRQEPRSFFCVDGWCVDKDGKPLSGFKKGKFALNGSVDGWQNFESKVILPEGTAKFKLCLLGEGCGRYQISHVFFGKSRDGENLVSNPDFAIPKGSDVPDGWGFTQPRQNIVKWLKVENRGDIRTPFVRTLKAGKPPVIDGNLDDACWKRLPAFESFVLFNGSRAAEKTEVKVTCDEKNLYIAAVCHESDMNRLVTNAAEIWKNDCVELFLDVGESGSYYHIIIDAAGKMSAAKRFPIGNVKKIPLEILADIKVAKYKDLWIVEAALPREGFFPAGTSLNSDEVYRINICRQEQPHREMSSWAPSKGSFHVPEYFGKIVFDEDIQPLVKFAYPAILAGRNDKITLAIDNKSDEAMPLTVDTIIFKQNSGRYVVEKHDSLELGAGEKKAFDINIPAIAENDEGDLAVTMSLIDSRDGKILYRSSPASLRIFNVEQAFAGAGKNLQEISKLLPGLPEGGIKSEYLNTSDKLKARLDSLKKDVNVKVPENEIAALKSDIQIALKSLQVHILFLNEISGKNLSFIAGLADSMTKIQDSSVDEIEISDIVKLNAARNEYESFQVIVLPLQRDLDKVEFDLSELKHVDGTSVIGKENISIKKIGYVKLESTSYKPEYKGLCPDVLVPVSSVSSIEKRQLLNPFWITIYIPPSAVPGRYSGSVKVRGKDSVLTFKMDVNVWNFSLSASPHLKTAFNFTAPWLCRFYYGSADYRKYLAPETYRKFVDMLLAYRIQTHFAGIWYSPFEMIYEKIPQNYLHKDKSGSYDFSQIIKNMNNFKSHGMNYSSIASFPRETAGGKYPEKFKSDLTEYLKEYMNVLKKNNFQEDVYLYMGDEPEPQTYDAIKDASLNICDTVCPGIKKMIVVDKRAAGSVKNLKDFIDIWVVHMDIFGGDYMELQKAGKELWFYVCSTVRPYPAFYIDYPAADHRIIPWICWKYDAKGFLYWGANGWWHCGNSTKKMNGDFPTADTWNPSCNLRNGSSYIMYPGLDSNREPIPLASLRMEIFRDGMEDYEYLYILKERVTELKRVALVNDALVKETEDFLAISPAFLNAASKYSQKSSDFYKMREDAARLIGKCDAVLNAVKAR